MPVPAPVTQPVLEMAATFAAALGPVLLRPAPRKRMVLPLAERPPMLPSARVAPTVAEGSTVMVVAPRELMTRPPKVSVVAAVAAVASRTSSPPCSSKARVRPIRLLVAAPSVTTSLPEERSITAPVPPIAAFTFRTPARMSRSLVRPVLATLKLTVPGPKFVKPPVPRVVALTPVPTRAAVLKFSTPPLATLAYQRFAPAATPPVKFKVPPVWTPTTASAAAMVSAPA